MTRLFVACLKFLPSSTKAWQCGVAAWLDRPRWLWGNEKNCMTSARQGETTTGSRLTNQMPSIVKLSEKTAIIDPQNQYGSHSACAMWALSEGMERPPTMAWDENM